PRRSDRLRVRVEELLRRGRAPAPELGEAAVDARRRLRGQLLPDYRPDEHAVGIRGPATPPGLEVERPEALDQLPHHGVLSAQVTRPALDVELRRRLRAGRRPRAHAALGRGPTRPSPSPSGGAGG